MVSLARFGAGAATGSLPRYSTSAVEESCRLARFPPIKTVGKLSTVCLATLWGNKLDFMEYKKKKRVKRE